MSGHGGRRAGAGRPKLPAKALEERQKARIRLAELTPEAVQVLEELMRNPDLEPKDRIGVVKEILDRGGLPRRVEFDHEGGETFSFEMLRGMVKELLLELMKNPALGKIEAVDVEFTELERNLIVPVGPGESPA